MKKHKQTMPHARKEWHKAFLTTLAKVPNVSRAAKDAGISRETAYHERRNNKAFATEWREALNSALDYCEQEVWRRGTKGTKKPVFYQGKVCGYTREFSDMLLMRYLIAHRPKRWRSADSDRSPEPQAVTTTLRIIRADDNSANPY